MHGVICAGVILFEAFMPFVLASSPIAVATDFSHKIGLNQKILRLATSTLIVIVSARPNTVACVG